MLNRVHLGGYKIMVANSSSAVPVLFIEGEMAGGRSLLSSEITPYVQNRNTICRNLLEELIRFKDFEYKKNATLKLLMAEVVKITKDDNALTLIYKCLMPTALLEQLANHSTSLDAVFLTSVKQLLPFSSIGSSAIPKVIPFNWEA